MFSPELLTIIEAIQRSGGQPLLVGGAVRDWLMGGNPKDLDLEVYNLPAKELFKALSSFGRVDQVGASFGVIKLKTPSQQEYDFALPRRENKVGKGYRGFQMEFDPTMTPEEACSRRDYTINAMAYDFATKQILDFFGGREDLQLGILRHASPAFAEDPLRVLRGFQFAARFNMKLAPDTAIFCQQLLPEYSALSVERVWGEWQKWALKGISPSAGLQFLKDCGWIDLYPEINKNFKGICQASEAMKALVEREKVKADTRLLLMFASLGYDLLSQLKAPVQLTERLQALLKTDPVIDPVTDAAVRRLSVQTMPSNIQEWACLVEAINAGKVPAYAIEVVKRARALNCYTKKPQPILMGKHLIQAGLLQPGPNMGRVIQAAYDAQIDGKFFDLENAMIFARQLLIG